MDSDDITQKYLGNPNECPFCGSSEITGDDPEWEFDTATRKIECYHCGKKWVEKFKMYDVDFDESDLAEL